jgi:hypothetical protein
LRGTLEDQVNGLLLSELKSTASTEQEQAPKCPLRYVFNVSLSLW